MKYWITLLAIFSIPTFANTVPAIQQTADAMFGQQKPLDAKSKGALSVSKNWIDAKQYPFQKGNSVTYLYEAGQATIVCAPMRICILELQEGERVVKGGVHLGDTARWIISPSVGANDQTHVIIKPVDVGLDTNLALITDRRTYNLRLVSRKNDYMPVVAFHYQDNLHNQWNNYFAAEKSHKDRTVLPTTGEYIEDLDFSYSIDGCKSCKWRPVRVYNNSQQTIIEMGRAISQTDAPALLVMTEQGEQLVNYRVKQGKYIVDQVFNKAILIVGVGNDQQKVTITNN